MSDERSLAVNRLQVLNAFLDASIALRRSDSLHSAASPNIRPLNGLVTGNVEDVLIHLPLRLR